jgi:hypothetical protein
VTRELQTVVLVDGVAYGPGYETPSDQVAARIKNPAAWGEDVDSDEGHGVPGNHEQLAAGLLPHAPVQPNQITMAEPAGPGGINPLLPSSTETGSSAVPAGVANPTGIRQPDAVPLDERPGGMPQGDQPPLGGGERADGQLSEPPRSGKGATTAAWRAYAEQFGAEVDDDADRAAIIAQLKDSGHIK